MTVYLQVTELDSAEKKWLFGHLWRSSFLDDDTMHCRVCGAREGMCDNDTCIRTRITNKLRLSDWGTDDS